MEVLGIAVAELQKIQTTLDDGGRITIDVGADSAQLLSKLLQYKLESNGIVSVTFTSNPEVQS